MTKLVMVRHGQSQANLDNRFTGWSDVPLTAKGIAQGKEVGADQPPASSPLPTFTRPT